MHCGSKLTGFASIVAVCVAVTCSAVAQGNHATSKGRPLPSPLPTGTTGPIQQIPLDSMEPVAPQVQYENGILTIVAANSTLGDILRALRKQTSAEIEIPDANERVVTKLGPGPTPEVISRLLNGSHYNYVLLFSPENPNVVTRILLIAKTTISEPLRTEEAQTPAPAFGRPPHNADDPDSFQNQDYSAQARKAQQQLVQQSGIAVQSPPLQPRGVQQANTEFDVPDPVPEPGTLLLVGSGLIGLALRSRIRQRSSRKQRERVSGSGGTAENI